MLRGIAVALAVSLFVAVTVFLALRTRPASPVKTPQVVSPAPADRFATDVRQGNAAMDAQQYEVAVAAFDRALKIRFDPDVATDRGICLHRMGRTIEALSAFEYVTLARPDHWQAHYNRAAVLVESGRMEEARRELAVLEKLKPNEPAVAALREALR